MILVPVVPKQAYFYILTSGIFRCPFLRNSSDPYVNIGLL